MLSRQKIKTCYHLFHIQLRVLSDSLQELYLMSHLRLRSDLESPQIYGPQTLILPVSGTKNLFDFLGALDVAMVVQRIVRVD